MGLIITSEIHTDGGTTSNAYINIYKYLYVKDSNVRAYINLYLNKESREEEHSVSKNPDANSKVHSKQVPSGTFGIANIESPSDFIQLEETTIYEFAYSKLKEHLEFKGLTVEDDL